MKPSMMGGIVTVHSELKRCKYYGLEPDKKVRVNWDAVRTSPDRAGWVVGERTLQNGIVVHSQNYSDEVEPGYLSVTSTTKAIMVCFWPSMKPVFVPVDGYTDGGNPVSPSAFHFQQLRKHPEVYERLAKELRLAAAEAPRDAKGRFSKTQQVQK